MNGMKTEMPDSFYYAFYMNLWKMTNMVRYARDAGFYNYLDDDERADIDKAIDDAQKSLDTYKRHKG